VGDTVKTKSARDVTDAFDKILTGGCTPNMVQSDKGTEFLNSTYQSMLKRHDIKFYTSENENIKAAVVERFIQQNPENEDVSLFHC